MENMKTRFIDDAQYKWVTRYENKTYLSFVGFLYSFEKLIQGEDAITFLLKSFLKIKSSNQLESFLKNITGHFSLYFSDSNKTIAIVDKIRSYPIYYINKEKLLSFSNSAMLLKSEFNLNTIDEKNKLVFSMAGYTLGNTTLFEDLFQIQAGELIFVDKQKDDIQRKNYYSFYNIDKYDLTQDELIAKFDEINKKVFNKLIETLDGRQVVIPLSGGLDCRFILAFLKEFGYDNIKTYTYGIKNLGEIKAAKYIAEKTHTTWKYIEFEPKEIRNIFHSEDRRDYFRYACGLNSTPNLSGYFAHSILRQTDFINKDAIIINGQSGDFTSGAHIPLINNSEEDIFRTKDLLGFIIRKHYALWTNLLSNINMDQLSNDLIMLFALPKNSKLTYQEIGNYFELIEWFERQSKYVVNGSRMYEWFGFDWRLPLWDDSYLDFWEKVAIQFKLNQNLLNVYLSKKNPGGLFNLNLPISKNRYSIYLKATSMFMTLLAKLSNNEEISKYQKLLKYYQQYGPYYPHQYFLDFLKDGKYHRNAVSYWSKYVLNEIL